MVPGPNYIIQVMSGHFFCQTFFSAWTYCLVLIFDTCILNLESRCQNTDWGYLSSERSQAFLCSKNLIKSPIFILNRYYERTDIIYTGLQFDRHINLVSMVTTSHGYCQGTIILCGIHIAKTRMIVRWRRSLEQYKIYCISMDPGRAWPINRVWLALNRYQKKLFTHFACS